MTNSYEDLAHAILEGGVENGVSAALNLVQSGTSPISIFTECIQPTLVDVGERFGRLEIFLPELMSAAVTVEAIQRALLPYIKNDGSPMTNKKIVIATVSGDLHDIGKNIVKTMLEVNGFLVHDLGVDVNPNNLLKAADEFNADIIALSALMLPSLPSVMDVIERLNSLEKYKNRFKVMVGGGSVTKEWAEKAGADGYGSDAMEAVRVAKNLLGMPVFVADRGDQERE